MRMYVYALGSSSARRRHRLAIISIIVVLLAAHGSLSIRSCAARGRTGSCRMVSAAAGRTHCRHGHFEIYSTGSQGRSQSLLFPSRPCFYLSLSVSGRARFPYVSRDAAVGQTVRKVVRKKSGCRSVKDMKSTSRVRLVSQVAGRGKRDGYTIRPKSDMGKKPKSFGEKQALMRKKLISFCHWP